MLLDECHISSFLVTWWIDLSESNLQAFLLAHTEPRLLDLLEELYPVCTSWYNIGLHLQIPYTTLDHFKQMYTDPLELMREMLRHWLDTAVNPPPTWKAVITALRSPLVNKSHLAEQLESKYCAPVQGEFNSEATRVYIRGLTCVA